MGRLETGIHHTTLLHLITESSLSLARTHARKVQSPALRRAARLRGALLPGRGDRGKKERGRTGAALPRHRRSGNIEISAV